MKESNEDWKYILYSWWTFKVIAVLLLIWLLC